MSVRDVKLLRTECFFNLSSEAKVRFLIDQRTSRLLSLVHDYYGLLPLPLAVTGLLLSLLFISVVSVGIKRRKISRKMYIFLLSRSIGDSVACLAVLSICIYIFSARHHRLHRRLIMSLDILFMATVFSAMVSYISLSFLKLFAVARPLLYRQTITLRKCVHIIIIGWMPPLLLSFGYAMVAALVFHDTLREQSGCKIETCFLLLLRVKSAISVAIYSITLSTFLCTILVIRKAKERMGGSSRSIQKRRTHPFPLWKISVNVLTFALLYAPYTLYSVARLLIGNSCLFVTHYALLIKVAGIMRATLILRINIDPLISFVTDARLRELLRWRNPSEEMSTERPIDSDKPAAVRDSQL